jgi:ribosomal protein S12 methylthiotransferase
MKLATINLGCPKNLVDLEWILGFLNGSVTLCNDLLDADAALINTCAFIDSAKEEAIETILKVAQIKQHRPDYKILVTGCLPQRYRQDVKDSLPEIDFVFTHTSALNTAKELAQQLKLTPQNPVQRQRLTLDHFAYLKLAKGCNNRCHYCAIPLIKGPYQSRALQHILEEARFLADTGVRELILTAQDITIYGQDLNPPLSLGELLKELETVPAFEWIRLLYTHPQHWTRDLIDTIARHDKVVPYVDMPLQHINNRMLHAMGRRPDRSSVEALIHQMRSSIPDVALRTTFIVGYPSESHAEFEELYDFVEAIQFERMGVFTYSPEEGTKAARLEDDVPLEIKLDRQDRLTQLQANLSRNRNHSLIGQQLTVLVDERLQDENQSLGRTPWDAPEIDNTVIVSGLFKPGTFVPVQIIDANEYELYGSPTQHSDQQEGK